MLFPGGIEATSNATLILSVAATVIYGLIVNMRPMPLRTAVKTLAVALLAVLTFVENGPALLFGALVLSACGDALLSRDSDRSFLAGLICFLAGYLCYIALFALQGSGMFPFQTETWRVVVAIAVVMLALVMVVLLWRRVKPAMRLPILVYVVAIVAMGFAALTLHKAWVIAGALLLIASDSLLAAEKFLVSAVSPHRAWMRHLVWALYYAAQAIITLSFLLK